MKAPRPELLEELLEERVAIAEELEAAKVESFVAQGHQLTPAKHTMWHQSTWSASKQRALQHSAAYAGLLPPRTASAAACILI